MFDVFVVVIRFYSAVNSRHLLSFLLAAQRSDALHLLS